MLKHLSVVKEGKTLKIGLEQGWNYQLKEPLKAEIVLPVLDALDAGARRRPRSRDFAPSRNSSSSSTAPARSTGSIDVGDADLDVSGASRLTLIGSARAARLSASGASHLKLEDFPVQQCEIELSGASSARLASRSDRPFTARLSGASHLEGHVDAGSVSLNLGGASVATLQGKADSAVLEAGGSSRLGLAELVVGEAKVKLSASSQATVDARKSLKYDLSSGSRLEYLGDPPSSPGRRRGERRSITGPEPRRRNPQHVSLSLATGRSSWARAAPRSSRSGAGGPLPGRCSRAGSSGRGRSRDRPSPGRR